MAFASASGRITAAYSRYRSLSRMPWTRNPMPMYRTQAATAAAATRGKFIAAPWKGDGAEYTTVGLWALGAGLGAGRWAVGLVQPPQSLKPTAQSLLLRDFRGLEHDAFAG